MKDLGKLINKIGTPEGVNLAVARDADKTFREQVCRPAQMNLEKKLNNLKTLVKKELANTKTSLSKKEKVTRATPQGVKLMKEERDVEARYQEYVGKLTHGNKANIEKQWKDAGEDMVKKHKVVVRAKELSKIKEYLTKQLKKEAVKFTIGQTGQEHEYKNPKDAPEFEKDLKAAGVKFTKSNV